ncbi:unnamed protein product [Albugo candida]|uniref:Uncharacterized protein n=1 Tax=Albugo candida TaxID=65357 RepID=A0A024G662_9STRA|nr:unnamed protein product [Albugo candida]|eukprot:CCI42340.1 unnamed protein product [Albugo candida]
MAPKNDRQNLFETHYDDLLLTFGPTCIEKKHLIQTFLVPTSAKADFDRVQRMTALHCRFRRFHQIHIAARIRTSGTRKERSANIAGYHGINMKCDELMLSTDKARATTIGESSEEHEKDIWEVVSEDPRGLSGMGDRLLHLLQRWNIENLILILGQHDASLSCRLMSGFEIYRQGLECAKRTLEEFLVAQLNTADTAKLEIIETPRIENEDNVPQELTHNIGRPPETTVRVNNIASKYAKSVPPKRNASAHPKISSCHSTEGLTNSNIHTEWIGITLAEWVELQSTRQYTKEFHLLLMCLVCVTDRSISFDSFTKTHLTNEMSVSFELLDLNVPDDLKWIRCLEVLHQIYRDASFVQKLHGSMLNSTQEQFIRAIFQISSFNEQSMLLISSPCVKVYRWFERLVKQFNEQNMLFVDNPEKRDACKKHENINGPKITNRMKSAEGKRGQRVNGDSKTVHPAAGKGSKDSSLLAPVAQLQQSRAQQPAVASVDLDTSMALKASRFLLINDSGRLLKR